LCDGGQHAVAAHGVERVPPVDLHGDAAWVGERAGAQGVTDDLAATRDAHCKLKRGEAVADVGAGSQGAEHCEPVPDFPDGDRAHTAAIGFG
jgi:hypothetical protein